MTSAEPIDDYDEVTRPMRDLFRDMDGTQAGDPALAAAAIITAVEQIVDTPGSGRIVERLADQWQVRRVPGPRDPLADGVPDEGRLRHRLGRRRDHLGRLRRAIADVGTRLISGCAG